MATFAPSSGSYTFLAAAQPRRIAVCVMSERTVSSRTMRYIRASSEREPRTPCRTETYAAAAATRFVCAKMRRSGLASMLWRRVTARSCLSVACVIVGDASHVMVLYAGIGTI